MNSDYSKYDKILAEIDRETKELEDYWYYNIRIPEAVGEELKYGKH